MNQRFWKGKNVLVTGHTGFKGSWLTVLLKTLGAQVSGYSLPPTNNGGIYNSFPQNYLEFESLGDLCELEKLRDFITKCKPDVIFHLAAQASVLESINNPSGTWRTNVHGTQNLLEVLRLEKIECICLIITTDKVYRNLELNIPFKEQDPLGGKDPYSSSKVAVEFLVSSYNFSFFNFKTRTNVSTARAGNVIGGGDWLPNRIIPDLIRAYRNSESLNVRNPDSVRPWQHVLDVINGYLLQAEYFSTATKNTPGKAFNFGPSVESQITVSGLISEFTKYFQINNYYAENSEEHLEAGLLTLDSELAHCELGWRPTMNFAKSVAETASWYRSYLEGFNPFDLTAHQISRWLTNEI